MNFDFSDDQKLLQQTARDYLTEQAPLTVCREILEGDQPFKKELWNGAAEMGWLGTVIPEEYGGAGFGHLELAMIAEELGRSLAPIPFGSSVYLATEALIKAGSDTQKQTYLPKLANGEQIGTFAFTEKPGQNDVESITAKVAGGQLSGTKMPVADGDVADFAVVAALGDKGLSLYLVDLDQSGVRRTPLQALDPSRSIARLDFDNAEATLLGEEGQGAALASNLLDRAAVLMAFEQLGAAQACFEATREFTLGRYAFGRPIASFQAIKHRLADMWCELEMARSNAYYGAWALSGEEPELPMAACIARIQATEALDLISLEMIQMHGGVGYTWEYDCHLFYRRAKALGAALGSLAAWKDKLVDRIQATPES